ncbi:MAG: site-specific integrase [Cyanobium sp.]
MAQRNAELAARGSRWSVLVHGQRLCLRGPLPLVNGGEGLRMQRLSLPLEADRAGLEQAMVLLEGLQRQLEQGRFEWSQWRRAPRGSSARVSEDGTANTGGFADADAPPAAVHAGAHDSGRQRRLPDPLAAFEVAFFADPRRRRQRAGSRTTWTAAYLPYLRRLARRGNGRTLNSGLLEEVLESYALASRSRQQCAVALAAFARHQGLALPHDWSERAAGYGLHQARFRQLPTDAEILDLAATIPNPRWRLIYGLIATYGLRNHEAFFCDTSTLAPGGDRVIRVLPTSKTGEHQVWPFQPQWVDHFGLVALARGRDALPAVRTDLPATTLQQVGRRVSEQFRRYGLPLTPYDLRHAWAVRTIHIGLPDTVAARMMGHSVAIHTRTYHHWITRRDQQRAVDAALERHQVA